MTAVKSKRRTKTNLVAPVYDDIRGPQDPKSLGSILSRGPCQGNPFHFETVVLQFGPTINYLVQEFDI